MEDLKEIFTTIDNIKECLSQKDITVPLSDVSLDINNDGIKFSVNIQFKY